MSDAPAGEPPESEPAAGEPPSIPAQRIRYFQRPRVRRRTGMLAAVVVGIVGAQLGMLLFGSTTQRVGPLEVQLDARLGAGDLVIALPPLGRMTADTHDVPLLLRATLTSVDVQSASRYLQRVGGVEGLVNDLEAAAADGFVGFGTRIVIVSIVGAGLLALVVFRLHLDRIVVAATTALVVVAASIAYASATFRPQALAAPRFEGTLSFVPTVLGEVERTGESFERYRVILENLVGGAVAAYTTFESNPVSTNEIRLLHISDIHLSVLGFGFARQLAESFDADVVVDTGDVTSFGTVLDERILSFIPVFARPYVFVQGNHDAPSVPATIRRFENASVLTGEQVSVAGLSVFGIPDPISNYDPDRPVEDEEYAEAKRLAGEELLGMIEVLPEPPDIVAVHDDRVAEALAGEVPLVLSGHFHETQSRVQEGTTFLRIGTTGGAGPISFEPAGGVPLEAELLHFRPGPTPELVAWDVFTQDPASGSFSVTRHLVDDLPEEESSSPQETLSP